MSYTAVTFVLVWLLAGSLIWTICDPARLKEFVERRHIERHGRFPSRKFLFFAHAGAIIAAPVLPVIVLVKLHRKVWG
jgi:hypothetical protein